MKGILVNGELGCNVILLHKEYGVYKYSKTMDGNQIVKNIENH